MYSGHSHAGQNLCKSSTSYHANSEISSAHYSANSAHFDADVIGQISEEGNCQTPYPLLDIYFQFFTANPQQDGGDFVAAKRQSSGVVDAYWDGIKKLQDSDDFLEGMLLHSVDYKPRYPFVHYIVTRSRSRNGNYFTAGEKDSAVKGRAYAELQTYVDRSTPLLPKRPSNPNAAYVVTSFKTLTSSEILAKNWTYWSGADYIVESVPKSLRLERMTFHRALQPTTSSTWSATSSTDSGNRDNNTDNRNDSDDSDFAYILVCELAEGLKDMNRTREFVDTLKYRQCGLTSLYLIDHFF